MGIVVFLHEPASFSLRTGDNMAEININKIQLVDFLTSFGKDIEDVKLEANLKRLLSQQTNPKLNGLLWINIKDDNIKNEIHFSSIYVQYVK